MSTHNTDNVVVAFEVLLEEIEVEIGLVDKTGAQAFELRDYDGARNALDRAGHLTAFRSKVAGLRDEWNASLGPAEGIANREEEEHASRRNLGRLKKGRKTPEAAYFRPILQALVDLGGSANLNEVLDRVEPMVKKSLKPIDFEPLQSDPSQIRWRNTAQWARFTMVQQDLLKSDSPRGVWEISDKGRRYLLQAK